MYRSLYNVAIQSILYIQFFHQVFYALYNRGVEVFAVDELDVPFWSEAIEFEFGKVAALQVFFYKKLRHDGDTEPVRHGFLDTVLIIHDKRLPVHKLRLP